MEEPDNYFEATEYEEARGLNQGIPKNLGGRAYGGRHSYEYSQGLINAIEQEIAEKAGIPYEPYFKKARGWYKKDCKQAAKKQPYINTEIEPNESRAKIYKMLSQYGAKGILFGGGYVLFSIDINGKPYSIRKLKPHISDERVAWRYLFWAIKSQLEALSSKMETEENVFLPDIIMKLPDGSYSTVGNQAKRQFLALPGG